MPYITEKRRDAIARGEKPKDAGELNYALTMVAIDYVKTHGLCYATINDILGAFDGASKEFYRRVAGPYEDLKIADNGDVYPRNT